MIFILVIYIAIDDVLMVGVLDDLCKSRLTILPPVTFISKPSDFI